MPQELRSRVETDAAPLLESLPSDREYSPAVSRIKARAVLHDSFGFVAVTAGAFDSKSGTETLTCRFRDSRLGTDSQLVLANDLVAANIVDVVAHSGRLYVAAITANGTLQNWQKLRQDRLRVFVIHDPTHAQPLATLDLRIGNYARIAPNGEDSVVAVSRYWYPPPDFPSSVPLTLSHIGPHDATVLDAMIDGTEAEGNTPSDWCVYYGPDQSIHIVYDGRRKNADADEAQYWHLKRTVHHHVSNVIAKPLGKSARRPILTQILNAPDGSIHFVQFSQDEQNPQHVEFHAFPLHEKISQVGAAMQCLIDYRLQPHVVEFRDGNFHLCS